MLNKYTKKADRYKDFVIECLQKYPDMSAAQIYDWIRERTCLETLEFQERAFRTYVKEIRNEYDLRKPEKNRQYEAVDELPMAWLERTANSKKHGTTQKIPAEVFELEREHLIPVSEYSFTPAVNDTITYQVRKDNIVLYKGNRYRVPKGTYEPGKKVYMMVENEIISITDCVTGEIYAKHPLCHEKGRLIGQKRKDRDKSRTIKEQENLLQELFLNDELVMPFLQHIHKEKPRYYRDQLGVIRRLFEEWNAEMLIEGLHYCTEREMYSAADLKSTVIYFNELKADKHIKKLHTALPTKYCGNKPQIRDLRLYEEAMERSAVNG